ncbi:MAG: response regulator transcription factor [Luteibacter sp.]
MSGASETRIRVMTVDDHPLMRDGIMAVLSGERDIQVVAEATCGLEAIERFAEIRPDVTLMDLKLPDVHGAEVITRLHRDHPDARFIILTTYQGDVQAARAFQAGASAYLLKGAMRTELAQTIRTVHAGGMHVPPEIAEGLVAGLGGQVLSAREVQVVELVAQGRSNKEIGAALHVSEDTVKAHLKRIAQKLHARDRAHMVAIALRRGYLIE